MPTGATLWLSLHQHRPVRQHQNNKH